MTLGRALVALGLLLLTAGLILAVVQERGTLAIVGTVAAIAAVVAASLYASRRNA